METITAPAAVLGSLQTAASLGHVLVVATTGATPGELLLAAGGWTAASTLAGVPLGLLLARGLRRVAPGPVRGHG